MGFSKEIAQNALVLSGYETLAAIDLLVTNPDRYVLWLESKCQNY